MLNEGVAPQLTNPYLEYVLILILMEHAQRALTRCSGEIRIVSVLILILMEHAQRVKPTYLLIYKSEKEVLILILMEHAQRANNVLQLTVVSVPS